MGREVRRVPPGWEHPRYTQEDAPYSHRVGEYRPLYDKDFDTAAQEWLEELRQWESGEDPDAAEHGRMKDGSKRYFWEWDGGPPNRDYYRPAWPAESATHYQMYETVSEGTPVSPVFAAPEELVAWLVGQGHSRKAAEEFVRVGYVPSSMMVISGGPQAGIYMGVDALDIPAGGDG